MIYWPKAAPALKCNANEAMIENSELINDLKALNKISQTLNRALDVRTALESSLQQLVQLMGLKTGWIFVDKPASVNRWAGPGYELAAHYQLPPALDLERREAWDKGCNCQASCKKGELNEAYNEVKCSRLKESKGERNGLSVHASTPLQSGSKILGILNVAAPTWDSFNERALALLTTVGEQMGVTLERAQLHDMLRERRVQEQSALLALSEKLLKRSSLEGLEYFIVNETQKLLHVDACALLLPDPKDDENLFFLAETGWHTDPVAHSRRVPANEQSWVGKAMIAQKPLEAEVDLELPQEALDRWALAENFKMMAAVPLLVNERSVGVLVVHTRHDHHFSSDDLRFLQLLANQAALALEAWRLRNEELAWGRTERELAFGREIQRSMLPDSCPTIPGWQFAVAYESALKVGGDFYDFFPFIERPDLWSIVIADVSDKGVPAALYMVLSRTTIRSTASTKRSPAEVLEKTNRYILEDSQADMFLSAFYATLDTTNGRLTYSNAGHNHPLWWQARTKQLVTLAQHGILLGVVDKVQLDDHQIELQPGDMLILYTDGITEAVDEMYQEFGEVRLKRVINESLNNNPELEGDSLISIILDAVNQFTLEQPLFDDKTLFIVKHTGSENAG